MQMNITAQDTIVLVFKHIKEDLATRFSLKSRSPYLLQNPTGWHTLLSHPKLSSPGSQIAASLFDSTIFVTHSLYVQVSWFFFPFPFLQLWTLPDVLVSGYVLPNIYNKLSPPPYLRAILSFPFLLKFIWVMFIPEQTILQTLQKCVCALLFYSFYIV